MLVEGTSVKPYTPHKSNKKQILYYNPTTQTWEMPILREWDSIEKHSDGKYYYHKRSGEVVLDGSENWSYDSASSSDTIGRFYLYKEGIALNRCKLISDRFELKTNYS